jgi:hypothetical protein
MPKRDFGCGEQKCSSSTGIHGDESHPLSGMTFGSGRLDQYGYWEFPCLTCARAFEKLHPDSGEAWPYADMDLQSYKYDDSMDKFFGNHDKLLFGDEPMFEEYEKLRLDGDPESWE